MKFSYLISFLQSNFEIFSTVIKQDSNFFDVILLDKTISFYREDALYIGHFAQLDKSVQPPVNLIYFMDDSPQNLYNTINSAAIHQKDFAAVVNAVNQENLRQMKIEANYADMLKMIINGKGLCDILNKVSEQVGNPMVILDISGKILANSTPFDVLDPLWVESTKLGYCPFEFMEHIKQQRLKRFSPATSEAFISICEQTHLVYLCSKILSKETLLGYVFIFECRKSIDEQSKQLLPLVSNVVCEVILRSQDNIGLRINMYRSILEDMLSGIDPKHANERIQASELKFPEYMRVVIVRPSYYHGQDYVKNQLQGALLKIFDKAPYIHHKGNIALIVPLNEKYHIASDSLEELATLIDSEHLQAGISNCFTHPWRFADYFVQADDALRFSQRLSAAGNIHYYEDYAFFSLLNSLPPEFTLGRYCHPALGLLRKYDHENSSELYKTLRVFTQSGFNQSYTAQTLFLHRNTLNYRKQRITEITGIDFTNPNIMFLLMYSFYIDDFLNNGV